MIQVFKLDTIHAKWYNSYIQTNMKTNIFRGMFMKNFFKIKTYNFYFITVVGVGVFYYYYQTFIKPQLGQNIDIKI